MKTFTRWIGLLQVIFLVAAGAAWAAPLPHPELFAGAVPGQRWLLDDGALELEVLEAWPDRLRAKVKVGGLLKARKGVHPVGLDVALSPLTPKDLEDIRWGVLGEGFPAASAGGGGHIKPPGCC